MTEEESMGALGGDDITIFLCSGTETGSGGKECSDASAFYNISASTDMVPGNMSNLTNASNLPDGDSQCLWASCYSRLHIILAAVVVTAIICEIVLGNLLVLIAIWRDRTLHTLQNWFIASLTIADFLVGLLVMPLSLANELMGHWYFGKVACEMWLQIDVFLCTASTLNLCIISIDRYYAVTQALSYTREVRRKKAILLILVAWGLSMLICVPPLVPFLGWSAPLDFTVKNPQCRLNDSLGYIIYSTMGTFYIPLVIMVVVYGKVAIAARRTARGAMKRSKLQAKPSMSAVDQTQNGPEEATQLEALLPKGASPATGKKANPTDSPGSHELTYKTSVTPVDHGIRSSEEDLNHSHIDLEEEEDSFNTNDHAESKPKYQLIGCGPLAATVVAMPIPQDNAIEVQNTPTDKKGQDAASPSQLKPVPDAEQSNSVSGKRANLYKKHESQRVGEKAQKGVNCSKLSKNESGRRSPVSIISRLRKSSSHSTSHVANDPEARKRRIARARERRATLVVGIIMGAFILCWFPFFTMYIIDTLIAKISGEGVVPKLVFGIFFWLGYCNSGFNPIIYTIFNREFRTAFQKILCCGKVRGGPLGRGARP